MNRQQRRAAERQGPAPAAGAGDVATLFAGALAHHQARRFADAAADYRKVLAIDPRHANSRHYLGVLASQSGRNEIAAAMIGEAIALNPKAPAFHGNLGNVLKALGRLDEAIACYRRAIALKPDFADAHSNLGAALKNKGAIDEAIGSYRRAIALKPDFADAHSNLGAALKDKGEIGEAIASYRRALALSPGHAQAHYNLGNALRLIGRPHEAKDAYRAALALRPDHGDALNNLGNTHKDLGELDEAVACYRRALALAPASPDTHNNLGNALHDQGKLEEAEASLRQAIALKPDHSAAHNNLGNVLKDRGRLTEAAAAYERALSLKPNHLKAHSNLGNILKEQGRLEEAIAAYERALALKADFADAHSNLLLSQHYVARISNAELLAAARRFGAAFEGRAARVYANVRDPTRRLKIGYVSGDLRQHPVGFFLSRVLEAHDRAALEIVCYSNHSKSDAVTERLRRASDHWRSVVGIADGDAAALIVEDRIDILVDLSGHTAKNRLPLFAWRPAPVQASWLGYFGTTGLGAIDYLVMDGAAVPAGDERWYVEAIARLRHGRFCYAPPDYAPEPAPPPALVNGYVTFGSFNNIAKIGPQVVALWADTLRAAPGSRLLLKWKSLDDDEARRRLRAAFAGEGIAPDRLELRGFSPHAQMLAQYGDVDIALDSFPFGGGLTSCEALWMGVPVVTLPGDRPASRQTVGFLGHLGLDECLARSPADYAERAAALAADPARLAALRRELRPRMAASPLCDGALFTTTLESAYRRMWTAWVAGEPPAAFDV